MSKERAKSFIIAMIEAGSNICAVGSNGYVVVEPFDANDHAAYERIEAVSQRFDDRDEYKQDIVDYLWEIGRAYNTAPPSGGAVDH